MSGPSPNEAPFVMSGKKEEGGDKALGFAQRHPDQCVLRSPGLGGGVAIGLQQAAFAAQLAL